jgi:hypothetical protein
MLTLRVLTLSFVLGFLTSDLSLVRRSVALLSWTSLPHRAVVLSLALMLVACVLLLVLPLRRLAIAESKLHQHQHQHQQRVVLLSGSQHLARRSSF